jgi:tetratricopeptide (TPR) repeat protein
MGDRYGQADTLDSLGYAYQHLHRYDESVAAYERSVGLYRELGVSFAEADTSSRLGDVLRDAGRTAAARAAWTRALDLLTRLGHPSATAVRDALMATDAESPPSVATSGKTGTSAVRPS